MSEDNSGDDIPLLFHSTRRLPRTELRVFFDDLVRRVARGRRISCLITGDRDLRRLNRQFLKKDYATDVLSFPSNGGGEIAISADRAAEQAAAHGHDIDDEIRILMLHGVLHLTGLDHETDSGEMARAELSWRRKLGLPTGLIERVAQTSNPPRAARKATAKRAAK